MTLWMKKFCYTPQLTLEVSQGAEAIINHKGFQQQQNKVLSVFALWTRADENVFVYPLEHWRGSGTPSS